MTVPDAGTIRRYVTARMRTFRLPGVAVTAVRDGAAYVEGFGFADLEHRVPVTERTLFQVGSVTKQFTTALVLQMVEAGKIRLDAPLTRYLPDLPSAWGAPTIQHLLTHTSGVPSFTELPGIENWETRRAEPKEVLATIADQPGEFAPGDRWRYSDTNYFLLGLVLERVTGRRYGALLKERIFGPLGMHSTRLAVTSEIIRDRARGYAWTGGRLHNARVAHMSWAFSAGAITASAADLARWDRALSTDKLLSRRSRDAMWTPVRLNDGTTAPYGFGWSVEEVNGHLCTWHSGSIAGFTSCIARFPTRGLSVVVLSNRDAFFDPYRIYPSGFLAFSIAGLCDPALARKRPDTSISPGNSPVARLVKGFSSGTFDESLCSPEFRKASALELAAIQTFFSLLGRPKSLKLVQRSGADTGAIRERWFFAFSTTGWIFTFTRNLKGQITRIEPEYEVP